MSNFLVKNGDKAEWGIPEGYPYDERIMLDLSKRYTTVEEMMMSVELLYDNTFIKLYDNVLSDTDVETMSVLSNGMNLTDAGLLLMQRMKMVSIL